MEYPQPSPRMQISELLALSPQMARLFIELRTDCIGCPMNKFCTLEELCRNYELDIDLVMMRFQARLVGRA